MKYLKYSTSTHNKVNAITKSYPINLSFKIGYVYIGKDIEDARNIYKFGYTKNLAQRLKHYKTGQPNFEFVLKIRTPEYKKLESELKREYRPYIYQNEIFRGVNLNNIKKQLKIWGYTPNADLIFEKKIDWSTIYKKIY